MCGLVCGNEPAEAKRWRVVTKPRYSARTKTSFPVFDCENAGSAREATRIARWSTVEPVSESYGGFRTMYGSVLPDAGSLLLPVFGLFKARGIPIGRINERFEREARRTLFAHRFQRKRRQKDYSFVPQAACFTLLHNHHRSTSPCPATGPPRPQVPIRTTASNVGSD